MSSFTAEKDIHVSRSVLPQVVGVLYVILYKTAMTAAQNEITKMRSFVAMIPVHVLTRQVSPNFLRAKLVVWVGR